jgi:hypothetical protein
LFATDLSTVLEDIIIVDPTESTRSRHISFFARVAPDAKVMTLRSFKQLAELLRG